MTKTFCDRCNKEFKDKDQQNIAIEVGDFRLEILRIYKGLSSRGHICHDCVRQIIAVGKPVKVK